MSRDHPGEEDRTGGGSGDESDTGQGGGLAEPLDPAVNPAMTWRPFSTFANLTVDMAVGNDFDEDHGHLYGTQPLAAWTAMLAPPGWEAADVERLREHLARLER